MPQANLEQERQRFLDQLQRGELDLSNHGGLSAYWQDVAREAEGTEDLGQLDQWVKDLARDKDRLAELKARQSQAASSQMAAADTVSLISRLLSLLDDIGVKLRRRLAQRRDELNATIVILGMKKKKGEDDKDEKATAAAAAASKKPDPKTVPTKAG